MLKHDALPKQNRKQDGETDLSSAVGWHPQHAVAASWAAICSSSVVAGTVLSHVQDRACIPSGGVTYDQPEGKQMATCVCHQVLSWGQPHFSIGWTLLNNLRLGLPS